MLREWLPFQDQFQHEILSSEGHGMDGLCSSCGKLDEGTYRCADCYHFDLLCKECCIDYHSRHPFHSISQWNGKYFQSITLQAMGFLLHCGHGGSPCPRNEGKDIGELTVMDVDRVHTHTVAWCGCVSAPERWKQLLRMKLYPASIHFPRTAFTFRLLRYYSIDTLECGATASSFMTKLQRLTNLYHPQTVAVSSLFCQRCSIIAEVCDS